MADPKALADAQHALNQAMLAAWEACEPPTEVQPGVYAGPNLPEMIRASLEWLGAIKGGTEALVRHRPGSWEAEHIRALAAMLDY